MASVGSLVVNVIAKTEKFTAGITKSLGMLSKFSRGLAGITKKLAIFTAAGATAAATGLALLTKSQFDNIDSTAKLSDKIGLGTEKLIAMQLAASEAGVEAGLLDNALTKLTKNIAESRWGGGVSRELDFLGLNAATINRLAPDEKLIRVAEALAKVRNQADKVQLTEKLFGRGGSKMLPVLELGRKGLLEYDSVARKLGLTFSREMAAGVEKFNDQFDRLKKTFVGLGTQLAVRVAPILEKVVVWMTDFLSDDNRIHKFADAITRGIGGAIKVVLDGIHQVRIAIARMVLDLKVAIFKFTDSPLAKRMGLDVSPATRKAMGQDILLDNLKLGGLKLQDPGRDFFSWYSNILDEAMKSAEPAVKKGASTFTNALLGGMDRLSGIAGGTARGMFDRFAKDPRLQNAIGQLSFGFAGRLSQMAAAPAMASRGTLAFAQAGSADSYRQQAAIRRQNEPMINLAKQQLKAQERIAKAVEKQAAMPEDKVANF